MSKFNQLSIFIQAVVIYIFSILVSLLFSPLFDKIYILILRPVEFGGDLYFPAPDWFEILLNGGLFAFYLFLPLFIFWLIEKRQWLIWFIGAIIPLSIALVGGLKDIICALVLTVIGYLLAQGILLIKKKMKK